MHRFRTLGVQREFNRRMKQCLQENEISLALPIQAIVMERERPAPGEARHPGRGNADHADRVAAAGGIGEHGVIAVRPAHRDDAPDVQILLSQLGYEVGIDAVRAASRRARGTANGSGSACRGGR